MYLYIRNSDIVDVNKNKKQQLHQHEISQQQKQQKGAGEEEFGWWSEIMTQNNMLFLHARCYRKQLKVSNLKSSNLTQSKGFNLHIKMIMGIIALKSLTKENFSINLRLNNNLNRW